MELNKVFSQCPECTADLNVQDRLVTCTKCSVHYYVKPTPCNAGVIEDDAGRILLVRRKFDPMKGTWDVPGGFVEFGESLEDSLRREVQEELGCEIGDIAYFASFADTYLYKDIVYHTLGAVFSARIIQGTITPGDDVDEYSFFAPEDLPYDTIAFPSVIRALKMYIQK